MEITEEQRKELNELYNSITRGAIKKDKSVLISKIDNVLYVCYHLFSDVFYKKIPLDIKLEDIGNLLNEKIFVEVYSKKVFDFIKENYGVLMLTDDENNSVSFDLSFDLNALLILKEGKAHGSYIKIYCTIDPEKKFEIYINNFNDF